MTISTLVNEEAIVRRSKTEPYAFAAIYEHYFSRVYNYMLYRVQDAPTAADLTARTFELALARLKQYDGSRGSFGGWLFAIAQNTVSRHWRRSKLVKWLPLEAVRNKSAQMALPEEAINVVEQHGNLLKAVATLPKREQNILAMKFGAEMTHEAIAEATGLSTSNVGVIVHRSIRKLRQKLETNNDELS